MCHTLGIYNEKLVGPLSSDICNYIQQPSSQQLPCDIPCVGETSKKECMLPGHLWSCWGPSVMDATNPKFSFSTSGFYSESQSSASQTSVCIKNLMFRGCSLVAMAPISPWMVLTFGLCVERAPLHCYVHFPDNDGRAPGGSCRIQFSLSGSPLAFYFEMTG